MVQRKSQPSTHTGVPDRLLMGAGVDPKNVWDAGVAQLPVEPLVLGSETPIVAAYIEGEEHRPAQLVRPEVPHERVRVLRGGVREHPRAAGVRGPEVAAP